ncbi:MAG: hypothetical protein K2J82_06000 [Muribaculaceae bacterium]|nr:hypothetical protein [Muribaculaceae bacterium]
MIYIWLDESDKKGAYFSNFYGGILINSIYYEEIISNLTQLCEEIGIKEEIKWQKVNGYTYEKYIRIVDFIFDILKKGYAKIRIFFHNNQFKAVYLTEGHKENEFTILYYEFIKHGFGLKYCDWPENERRVRLYIDDIPARGSQVEQFKKYILNLNNDVNFKANKIRIEENDIIEVDSSKHLPLQLLDLILGAMCFRLNNKHKIKQPDTGKRGKRTVLKEKLYKYILSKIYELKPNFNIGVSTGIQSYKDKWTYPYRHWSFKPSNYCRDYSQAKP